MTPARRRDRDTDGRGDSLRVLSLGAGVQSTTVLLMSALGELPPVDAAIFADTGWEPRAVYGHLWWLAGWLAEHHPVPLYVVSVGDIRADALDPAHRFVSMPLFVPSRDRRRDHSMLRRQCTHEYKLVPIRRWIRALMAEHGVREVEQWLGISLDEVHRMKDPDVGYLHNRYPLVDERMTRWDCLRWLQRHDFPAPPKSACIGCPLHSDERWRALRDEAPDEWADAVAFEAALSTSQLDTGKSRIKEPVFLHRSLLPLPLVDLSTPGEHGQLDLFGEECEGMCGV